jgi:hypothetical protein
VASGDETVRCFAFNPMLAIDYYYADSLQQRMSANPLFEPKRKDEKKDAFDLRLKEATVAKNSYYNLFWKTYISKPFEWKAE